MARQPDSLLKMSCDTCTGGECCIYTTWSSGRDHILLLPASAIVRIHTCSSYNVSEWCMATRKDYRVSIAYIETWRQVSKPLNAAIVYLYTCSNCYWRIVITITVVVCNSIIFMLIIILRSMFSCRTWHCCCDCFSLCKLLFTDIAPLDAKESRNNIFQMLLHVRVSLTCLIV